MLSLKRCSGCNTNRSAPDFGVNKATKDGLQHHCKSCRSGRRHTTDRIKRTSQWLVSNAKRRAQLFSVPFDPQTVKPKAIEIQLRRSPLCAVCLTKFDFSPKGGKYHNNSPSIDRIEPHLGYVSGNISLICMFCNIRKSDSTPRELAIQTRRELVTQEKRILARVEYLNRVIANYDTQTPRYQTDLAQHARSCDEYADRVAALYPEQDLSPLSIRASQDALERHCKALTQKQVDLRQEAEFFDEGEDYLLWDLTQQM